MARAIYDKATEEWFNSYREYLRSAGWRARRRMKLASVGFRCEVDGRTSRLEVHHTNYAHLGDERFADLLVMCERCHLIHSVQMSCEPPP